MNMRKIIAVLASALLLCTAIPMGALSVAAAGDVVINYNFDDGVAHFERGYVENGYMVFDGTTASWQNTYLYANAMKANTDYVATFKAKANKDANLGLKINNNWAGDTAEKYVSVTTEWQDFEIMFNTSELADLTSTALVMFYSPYDAAVAPIYCIDDLKIVEYVEPLEVGVVKNGNFENGSEGWILNSSASIENGALKLNNSGQWSEAAMAEIAVEVGTEYTLSWKSQRVSGNGAFLMFVLNPDNTNHPTSGDNWMNNPSTDWIEQSIKFTAEAESLKLKLSAEVDNPGVILIDDIKLTAEIKPEVGKVTNGDFETGDITGWNKWQSTEINADAAHTGSYGAHIMGNGGWGGMLDQHISIEDGKTYELSFWYKVNNGGFNWKLTGDASGTVYGSGWVTTSEWTQVTKTFVAAGDTSIFLNINGGGNGVAENAYIDDVMIKEVKDPSDDGFVKNGDFETGKDAPWTLYSGTAVSAEAAYTGNFGLHIKNPTGGWGGTAFQDFSVEIGKTYEVSMWAKNLNGARGQNIQIQNGGANVASKWFDNTNEWTLLTFEFTATATNTRINICGGGTGANEELYVDDIKVKELIDPSFDGYIYNGDFETGEVFPWDNLWGSCPTVEIVEGKDGYGLHIVSGQWKHVRQTNIAVEANTNYKITAWVKNAANMSLLVKDGGDSKDIVNAGVSAGDEWTEITKVFNTGDYTTIIFSLMGGAGEDGTQYGIFDNIKIEKFVCEHEYDDCMDADCNLCGETREPGHVLTYFEAVVATNCQETGHAEYWHCENCDCYFGDAEATWQHNPGWLFTTGECVRPEGAADCAVVPCTLCGNDTYGAGEHDVLICQGGTCSKCNAEIEGVGCQNYDTPACEDGVCYYCGGFVAGFGHENGAWAPCCDGECAYGCGLIYPATEDHVDADGDDYCDNCWNHLACIDADADGFCDVCWSEMPAAEIVYGDANGDGDITADDVILLQQFLAEWEVELNEAGADANGDGDITADDVILLQQYLAEWDVTLGPV